MQMYPNFWKLIDLCEKVEAEERRAEQSGSGQGRGQGYKGTRGQGEKGRRGEGEKGRRRVGKKGREHRRGAGVEAEAEDL